MPLEIPYLSEFLGFIFEFPLRYRLHPDSNVTLPNEKLDLDRCNDTPTLNPESPTAQRPKVNTCHVRIAFESRLTYQGSSGCTPINVPILYIGFLWGILKILGITIHIYPLYRAYIGISP